jgi:type III pantothenate kinase
MSTAKEMMPESLPLVVADVGNSRVKLGEFAGGELAAAAGSPLPHPLRAQPFPVDWTESELDSFLPNPSAYRWAIASVNHPVADRLLAWLARRDVDHPRVLSHVDMPLVIDVEAPAKVGIDRLANAVAVNRLRPEGSGAIIIDLGTAIKVDLVSADGAFAGGAILPGIAMAARALHEFTHLLPLVTVSEPPEPLGKSTAKAMSSGLYWGAVGAVRELVARLSDRRAGMAIYLTGGAAPNVSGILEQESDQPPLFVPHLTLSGIALATLRGSATRTLS